MSDSLKNLLIGLFVVVACSLLIGIILFLEPTVGDGKQTLVVRFSNINGITVGTRVMFAGKPVGEVTKVEQIPQAREQPTDELGQVYFYQLILHVDSSVDANNTDEFTVQTSGLLGEKSIAIIPKAPPKGVKPKRITRATPVYAESNDPLESAFNELAELSDKVEETLDKVISWIDQNGNELGGAIKSFDAAMAETSEALKRANDIRLVDDLKGALQHFSVAMGGVSESFDQMQRDEVFSNLGAALSSMAKVAEEFSEGKGTLGKLLNNETTYLQLSAILSKVNTLMNDVNHYGVLFNLNKEWQRSRTKQASFMNALKTPASFKNYFEREVDLINTSMERLSMLVEKAENSPDREAIFSSKAFQRDFAELLRQTKVLTENLKLYNEQLMEAAQ